MPARFVRRRLLTAVLLASTILATATSPAWAAPSLADRETARTLMDDGDARRDKGDLKGALKSYEAADAIMHVPTTTLEVARTQANLGLLLEARETLVRLLHVPAKPGEPAPFTAARKTAESLSVDVGARIPSVTVNVSTGDPAQTPVVIFDGEVIPPAAARAPRKVNPGRHVVSARAGTVEKTQDVDVAEREAKTVLIDLTPAPLAATSTPGPAPSSNQRSALPGVLIYGGFGLGAVGLGVGTVTGLMSLAKVNDVKKDCVNDVCPAGRQGDIDSAKTLGTVSTVAFVAGGVFVGTGILGLVLRSRQTPREQPVGTTATVRVRPELGPTWAGLRGTF